MLDARRIADLPELGRVVQDDELSDDDHEGRARAAERFERYVTTVDQVTGSEDESVLAALLASVHDLHDHGAYERTYGAVWSFPATTVGRVVGRYLPAWVERFDDEAENVARMLQPLPRDPVASEAFRAASARWDDGGRAAVRRRVAAWLREDAAWEGLARSLGVPVPGGDPAAEAPADWPEAWQHALADLRRGVVATSWPDQRDPTANFPLVLALLETEHGARWREVGALLNPLDTWALRCYPDFVESVRALAPERAERVLRALRRARPAAARRLEDALGAPPRSPA